MLSLVELGICLNVERFPPTGESEIIKIRKKELKK